MIVFVYYNTLDTELKSSREEEVIFLCSVSIVTDQLKV